MQLEMENFKEYLKNDRRLASGTIRNYIKDVKKLQDFLGKPLIEIQKEDIRTFMGQMDNSGVSCGHVSNHVISFRAYFKWLSYTSEDEHVMRISFFLTNIVKISRHRSIPHVPTPEEIEKLRSTLNAHKQAAAFNEKSNIYFAVLRDIAALELLITSGIRANELKNLKFCDILIKEKVILVKVGKGGKQRCSLFGAKAAMALEDYFKIMGFLPNDYIFHFKDTNRINAIVKRWANLSGINELLHTHSFRHFFITESKRKGIRLEDIASQVGHVNLNTTRGYTHLNIQHLKEQFAGKDI